MKKTMIATVFLILAAACAGGGGGGGGGGPTGPELQPPAAPSNLAYEVLACPEEYLAYIDADVRFTWQDNSDNEEGFVIAEKVETNWQYWPNISAGDTAAVIQVHLIDEGGYSYWVYAYNQAGDSEWSDPKGLSRDLVAPLCP